MAHAVKTTEEVYIPGRYEDQDVVTLTLTLGEAQSLRNVLGHTDSRVVGDSNMGDIYDALEPLTEVTMNDTFYINRRTPF